MALCLERGAPINAVDESGQTVLHLAVASGPDSVVKLLAEKGADLFAKDQRGRTPLDVALGVGGGRGRGGQNAGNVAPAATGRPRPLRLPRPTPAKSHCFAS